jgi:hypothetical protein
MYSPLLFSINIEYDYSFDKNTTKLVFHFFGYDRWDFEKMEAKWYEIKKHLYNLMKKYVQVSLQVIGLHSIFIIIFIGQLILMRIDFGIVL